MHKKATGMEIKRLSNIIARLAEPFWEQELLEGISSVNGRIIGYIGANRNRDIFQRDLEQKFGITRSTASKVVNLMVKKDLIRRDSVSYDARLKKLTLTEKSLKMFQAIEAHFEALEAELTQGFSSEELQCFFNFIDRMKQNLVQVQEKNQVDPKEESYD